MIPSEGQQVQRGDPLGRANPSLVDAFGQRVDRFQPLLRLRVVFLVEPTDFGVIHLKPSAVQFRLSSKQNALANLEPAGKKGLIEPGCF